METKPKEIQMKKAISLVLLGAIVIMATGCTGPFTLTQKLHKLQTSPESKWADEGLFLVIYFIPIIAGVTVLADMFVFNTIDFWTGENPMDSVNNQNGDELCLRSVAEQM